MIPVYKGLSGVPCMVLLSCGIPSVVIQTLSLWNLGCVTCERSRFLFCTIVLSYKPNHSILREVPTVDGQGY